MTERRETAALRAARKAGTWWTEATKLTRALTGLVAALGTTAVAVAAMWPSAMPVQSATATPTSIAPCFGDGCGPEFWHEEREHWDQVILPPVD